MKQVDGKRRRARWAKKTSSGTKPGTATIRHPVAASSTSVNRRKSGIPSAATPSAPSPSRNSRQARPTSSRCWRSNQEPPDRVLFLAVILPILLDRKIRIEIRPDFGHRPAPNFAPSHARLRRLSNVAAGVAHQSECRASGGLWQAVLRNLAQPLDQTGEVFDQLRKTRLSAVAALVHIERPVDLDLQRVAMRAGTSVSSRRGAPGIGRVDRDSETAVGEKPAGCLEDAGGAGRAVAIAEDDIGAVLAAARARRHRMAIDEEITAEHARRLLDQPAQHLVVRVVEALDAPFGIGEAQLLGVDILAAGNDAGDRAEPDATPRRAGIDVARQGVGEHRGVELVSFPVDVEIGPRKAGREQRGAELRGGGEQFVDKAVF